MLNLDWTDTPAAGEYATGEGDGFRKGLNHPTHCAIIPNVMHMILRGAARTSGLWTSFDG
jgi:hypothetical protein